MIKDVSYKLCWVKQQTTSWKCYCKKGISNYHLMLVNMINRVIVQRRSLEFNTDYDVLVFETFLTTDIDVCGLDMISNAEIEVKNSEPLSYI